jgi:hypothetical protein
MTPSYRFISRTGRMRYSILNKGLTSVSTKFNPHTATELHNLLLDALHHLGAGPVPHDRQKPGHDRRNRRRDADLSRAGLRRTAGATHDGRAAVRPRCNSKLSATNSGHVSAPICSASRTKSDTPVMYARNYWTAPPHRDPSVGAQTHLLLLKQTHPEWSAGLSARCRAAHYRTSTSRVTGNPQIASDRRRDGLARMAIPARIKQPRLDQHF